MHPFMQDLSAISYLFMYKDKSNLNFIQTVNINFRTQILKHV